MGPDNRRILVAAALSVGILVLWQVLFPPARTRHPAGTPDAGIAAAPGAAPAAAPAPTGAPPPVVAPPASEPEKTVTLETPELRATFSSWGGAVKALVLKGEKFRRDVAGRPVQIDLIHVAEGEPLALALAPSPELGGQSDALADPSARAPMRVVAADSRSVTFEGRVGSLSVKKRYELTDRPYEITLQLSWTGADRTGALFLLSPGWNAPAAPKSGFSPFSGGQVVEKVEPLCRAGDKTARFSGKEAMERLPGAVSFFGLDQHYFVTAVLPPQPMGECIFARGAQAGGSVAALRLPVEHDGSLPLTVYAGPKQLDLLRSYGRGLDSAVDYGTVTNLFAFFARILLAVMRAFQRFVQNWGIAIILLTVLVKAILYPLTAKSMASMNEMRKLQPEIEKLKAKFGDDKEKMNLAVMKLYQEHKVNPLGGCLPMLLQMPIWLALYATLQTSVELYREPFLWIHDLTLKDPYYVLPLAMGASSFLMQKLSPQPADNAQAKMMLYFMPAFFTFIMMSLPAGLTLYILVNNLLSIAQQQWLMRRQPAPAVAKA